MEFKQIQKNASELISSLAFLRVLIFFSDDLIIFDVLADACILYAKNSKDEGDNRHTNNQSPGTEQALHHDNCCKR